MTTTTVRERVKHIVAEALEQPVGDRNAFVTKACAGDEALQAEVSSLLAQAEATRGFLARPAALEHANRLDESLTSRWTGTRLGPWQIDAPLGRGGMGEVYRAHRADGTYEQSVALKLIRRGFDSQAVLKRFKAERQILAGLDHPHIARLLDGGSTAEGDPYFVMELVDGIPIDRYCQSKQLGVQERLRLFLDVCSAVQHAHQRLVVHRDLKASNILVTEQGVVKLLDFGIAKLVEPGATDTAPTMTAEQALTPEYASPEQVRGEPVTTSSDVYSLGVVLYRLLTNRSPYDAEPTNALAMMKAICETEPTAPSEARPTPDITHTTQHGTRSKEASVPSLITAKLKGDLDSIVLKALRKEPIKRYQSTEQLALDIQRHLDGRPVEAREGTWRYRAGRFIVRNKWAVAASTLIATTLIAATGISVRQARIAEEQATIAKAEKERAERHFASVRKLANTFVFDVHDQLVDVAGTIKAREKLVATALRYTEELSKEQQPSADLAVELATAYRKIAEIQGNTRAANVGDFAGANKSLSDGLRVLEPFATTEPNNVSVLRELFNLHKASSTLKQAMTDKSALVSGREVVRYAKQLERAVPSKEHSLLVGTAYYELASIQSNVVNDQTAAFESARQASDIYEALLTTSPTDTRLLSASANAFHAMSMCLTLRNSTRTDLEKALEFSQKSLTVRERLAQDSPNNARLTRNWMTSLSWHATMQSKFGKHADGEATMRTAMEVNDRLKTRDGANSTTTSYEFNQRSQLAQILHASGDDERTIHEARSALAAYETFGDDLKKMYLVKDSLTMLRWTLAKSLLRSVQSARHRGGEAAARRDLQAARQLLSLSIEALRSVENKTRDEQNNLTSAEASIADIDRLLAGARATH